MDELTRWVNEATSLLPRKVTKTGQSRRKPAHVSKIQRACDRQTRLLEREAMIAKDRVTDGFIVTHSMRQISTLPHIDAVAPIKLVLSSLSASNSKDWRMALQQGILERRQVLREAHRLQRTELLQKLRVRCRECMDRPGEREIQELMGKRVKQDAPDYMASQNPARVDDQQEKPHRYCTDHATIELTRLAPCDLRVRISPMHLLTDLLEERPDVDTNTFTSTNPMIRNHDMTRTQCAMRNVFLL